MTELTTAPVDVSRLPRVATGASTVLFWGTVLLMAIEGTSFAILFTSYFYVRNNFQEWPPAEHLRIVPGAISALSLLSTLLPSWFYQRAARARKLVPMRRWLLIATGLSVVAVALRWWEIGAVPFSWTGNAYTSVVWMSTGMHTFDLCAGLVESIFLCGVICRSRFELKSFADIDASALFWYFTVLVWLPFAAVFYLDGAL